MNLVTLGCDPRTSSYRLTPPPPPPSPQTTRDTCVFRLYLTWPTAHNTMQVGGFVWSAGRRREGNIETMAASSPNCRGGPPVGGVSTTTSITSSAQSARDLNEQTAQAQVVEELRKQRDSTNQSANSARSCTSSNSSGGGSTWRSGATSSSASMPSSASYNTSRLSSARSSCSSNADGITENQCRTRRSTTPPTTRSVQSSENDANSSSGNNTGRQRSHRSTNETTPRETRLGSVSRATPGAHGRLQHTARRRNPAIPPASPATARQLSQFKTLDPVFQPHHKYDLIAQERAARGGEVTGRFGPVDGSSVLAASLLTSELSTPWSHVLRGQKW